MLPLEVSGFGILIGALLLVSIESTYIQYTYLISVVFQGKCFIILSEIHFFCQQQRESDMRRHRRRSEEITSTRESAKRSCGRKTKHL